MTFKFSKMHGLGNDFVVFETLTQDIAITAAFIKKIADRHYGIGCDQVLVIGKSKHPQADFDYAIYNADGSSAKQCGNGARCIARFVKDKQLSTKNHLTFATFDHLTTVDIHSDHQISVKIGVPNFSAASLPMLLPQAEIYSLTFTQPVTFSALSIGNPHVIIQVPDVAHVDMKLGAAFNQHACFPEGVNVSFCQMISPEHLALRVYERGVGETLACGSAASASMAALRHLGLIEKQVRISLPGGDLTVNWDGADHAVILTGDATPVFDGSYSDEN